MNQDQVSSVMLEHSKEISALWESSKSSHKRHDDYQKIVESVHELSKNVATMAAKTELLAIKMDKGIERMEQAQKSQGERLGKAEAEVQQIGRIEKEIIALTDKIDKLRMEPADKWKSLMTTIITEAVTAVIVFLLGGAGL